MDDVVLSLARAKKAGNLKIMYGRSLVSESTAHCTSVRIRPLRSNARHRSLRAYAGSKTTPMRFGGFFRSSVSHVVELAFCIRFDWLHDAVAPAVGDKGATRR